MADQLAEQSIAETPATQRAPIETASRVMANPDHPQYTADKAVAKQLVGGRSALIAAIDGMGSGGQASERAAEIVQQNLNNLAEQLKKMPTINQGANLLITSILTATAQIKELQRSEENSNVDTTVSTGIVCESSDSNRLFLVSANVGDSRIYRYCPNTGAVEQLTVDHTLVQILVDTRQIPPDKAFTHSQRNILYRTVGLLRGPDDIDIRVTEIQRGDIFLAVSDGLSGSLTPRGLPAAVRSVFQEAYNSDQKKLDLNRLAFGLAQRARNIQVGTKAAHSKPDDICIAVLRVPIAK